LKKAEVVSLIDMLVDQFLDRDLSGPRLVVLRLSMKHMSGDAPSGRGRRGIRDID
jgi:hypothetical protein